MLLVLEFFCLQDDFEAPEVLDNFGCVLTLSRWTGAAKYKRLAAQATNECATEGADTIGERFFFVSRNGPSTLISTLATANSGKPSSPHL